MATKRHESRTAISEGTGPLAAPVKRRMPQPRTATQTAVETPANATDCYSESAREEIARISYSYWEGRGCQNGSPEEDWLRAEQEHRGR